MKITLRTALITGSSRGLGRAIAVKLAQEGVRKIAVHYLSRRNEAEKTVSQIRDAGAEGVLAQVILPMPGARKRSSRKLRKSWAAAIFLYKQALLLSVWADSSRADAVLLDLDFLEPFERKEQLD